MFNKRALEISTTTIVVAAIALIILVVLIGVFTGRMGSFVKGVDTTATCKSSCEAFGRGAYTRIVAKTETECNAEDKTRVASGTYEDIPAGKVCCCKALA